MQAAELLLLSLARIRQPKSRGKLLFVQEEKEQVGRDPSEVAL